MSLWLDGVPNKIALAGGRELNHCPWHFVRITMDENINRTDARNWIWKNLEGRFCMISSIISGTWKTKNEVAFEEPYEASAFIISQPLMIGDHDSFW